MFFFLMTLGNMIGNFLHCGKRWHFSMALQSEKDEFFYGKKILREYETC